MKSNRGAITIITLVTVLFMLAFLTSTYVIIANRRQAQAEIKKEIANIYEEDIPNLEQIYNGYFAEKDETIPVKTAEQLLKIGTGKYIISDNKIYECLQNSNYKLETDLELKYEDYSDNYPDNFEEKNLIEEDETGQQIIKTANRWINIEEQITKGSLTGTFNYNGYKITETDSEGNTIIHFE